MIWPRSSRRASLPLNRLATFRLRAGCSASTWSAPDGSSLLTLDGPSVQTAPDRYRRIVWTIKRMINAHPTEYRCQGKQVRPGLMDDQGASDTKSDATPLGTGPAPS